jgi:hypothetical protein
MDVDANKLTWTMVIVALTTTIGLGIHTMFPNAMSNVSADALATLTSFTKNTASSGSSNSVAKKTAVKDANAQKIWNTLSDGQTLTGTDGINTSFSYDTGLQKTIASSINGIPSSDKVSSVLYTQDNSKLIIQTYTYIVAKDGTIPAKLSEIDDSTSYSVGIGFQKLIQTDQEHPEYADTSLVNENLKLTGKELKNIASVTNTTNALNISLGNQASGNNRYGDDIVSEIANASGLYDSSDKTTSANNQRLNAFIDECGYVSNPATILAMYSTYNIANSTN